jgi:raffinose/stachyose/melibiose transport system permease protein
MLYRMKRGRNKWLLICTAPALVFFLSIKLIPSIMGLWYSLTNWNGINPSKRFIGFENFREIFTSDAYFWDSMGFTLKYVIWIVIVMNLTALFLAVAIESLGRGKGVFRTLFYLPNMISMIIGGFMWNFIFTKVLYHFSDNWGWMFFDKSWIGNPQYSFYAILVVALWGGTGYLMVIYIAAIQGVPKMLHEAAVVDGAGKIRRFFVITLPMIRQAFTICLFISLNNAFQVFDVVYALTGGGPGRSTQVVALNIYQEAFGRSNRFGYATAKSTILFAVILGITLIQLRVMKRKEQEL